jgi:putative transposase
MRQDEAILDGCYQRLCVPRPSVPAPVFAAAQLDRMEEIMGAVCADLGCELIEFNGEAKTSTCSLPPPTVALSRLVNSLKSDSSRRLRHVFAELAPQLLARHAVWCGTWSPTRSEVPR